MEEITGTLALEREILDDARKKAARLLTNAETAVSRLRKEAEEKTVKTLDEIGQASDLAIERYRNEVFARLPLEKLRLKTAFADDLLHKSLDAWLDAIPEARIEAFASRQLESAATFFSSGDIVIRYWGIKADCVGRIAKMLDANPVKIDIREDVTLPSKGIVVSGKDTVLEATLAVAAARILRLKRGDMIRVLAPGLVES